MDLSFDAATMKIVSLFWNFSCSESFLLDDNNSGLSSNSKSALFYRDNFFLTSRRLTIELSKKNHNTERTTITKIIVYIHQLLTHFCFPTLGLQQLFLHLDVFSLIFNLCVCVYIKAVFEVIFCLIILNLSLYDVKYKCIFSIVKKLQSLYMYMLDIYFNLF
jgi:hypothetical protein